MEATFHYAQSPNTGANGCPPDIQHDHLALYTSGLPCCTHEKHSTIIPSMGDRSLFFFLTHKTSLGNICPLSSYYFLCTSIALPCLSLSTTRWLLNQSCPFQTTPYPLTNKPSPSHSIARALSPSSVHCPSPALHPWPLRVPTSISFISPLALLYLLLSAVALLV